MAAPTESSRLWTTGGAGDGASTYTRDQLAEMFRALLADPTTQGVLLGLAVSGSTSPLTLAVGAALVYGFWYFCTVAGDVAVTTPSVGTTGFRVVLRAGWTAQTVRVAVVMNTDGVAAIPAVTQSAGTTWEITLATGTITTGGAITLTDARDMVGLVRARQGGSATDWGATGTTSRVPDQAKLQAGSRAWSGSAADDGSVTVTFPQAYSNVPLACTQAYRDASGGFPVIITEVETSNTELTIHWRSLDASTHTALTFHWMALGPE